MRLRELSRPLGSARLLYPAHAGPALRCVVCMYALMLRAWRVQVEAIWQKFGADVWQQLASRYPDVDVQQVGGGASAGFAMRRRVVGHRPAMLLLTVRSTPQKQARRRRLRLSLRLCRRLSLHLPLWLPPRRRSLPSGSRACRPPLT